MAEMQQFDYIIVGGGTAGCVIASRLKRARPDWSIALVERGPDERQNPTVLNPLGVTQLKDIGLDEVIKTEPQSRLSGRQIDVHAGRMLSGSSAVNYGVWMRGDRKDYEEWAELVGDKQWNYDGLLPFFRRSETHWDPKGDRTQHGFEGPLKISAGRRYPLHGAVLQGWKELGLCENGDANAGSPLGIGDLVENWSPIRQPAGLAYDLSGVSIITDTVVKRVLLEQRDGQEPLATGVELTDGKTLHATKEVVVSCGAYRTPQVLMLSGIGPSEELTEFGIEVALDRPDVGANLFDHLCLFLCFKLDPQAAQAGLALGHPTFMANPKNLEGSAIDFSVIDSLPRADLKSALQADAPGATSVSDDHPLLRERAHHWLMVAYMALSLGDGYDIPFNGEHITMCITNFQPTSRGKVGLRSTDPRDWPSRNPSYNDTEHDRYVMRAAVRKMLNLAETSSLKPIILGEVAPVGELPLTSTSSDEAIAERIAKHSQSIQHGGGTAAMGKVVDARLRVKGVAHLRVCDASVFPAPISATTQSAVYAVAEKCAAMILQGA